MEGSGRLALRKLETSLLLLSRVSDAGWGGGGVQAPIIYVKDAVHLALPLALRPHQHPVLHQQRLHQSPGVQPQEARVPVVMVMVSAE